MPHGLGRVLLAASVLMVAAPAPGRAQGFLGGGAGGLDPKFCRTKAVRQTVVYIDDSMMRDGQTDWAEKLLGKLKATLAPGERVSVVELSPDTGTSNEKWSGCWPNYSAVERDRMAKQTSYFSSDPLKALAQQQTFFAIALQGSLDGIYITHKQREPAFNANEPPSKQLVAAFASDEGRYSHSDTTVRAIVYSNLAENSDLGSVYKPLPSPFVSIGKKLGTSMLGSVFYAYGIGRGAGNSATVNEQTRTYWFAVLGSMQAAIGGISSDLNVPNDVPVEGHNYQVDFKEDAQTPLSGRMSILVDADGALVDSWMSVNRLSTAELTGTMRCEGDTDTSLCALNATTSHGIVSDSRAEALTLHGDAKGILSGQFGVKGSQYLFPLTAKAASIN